MRFQVENFGCRTNQAECVALAAALRARGLEAAHASEPAEVVILNTCTVTAAAERQARERIRELHRRHPAGTIVVTGCYAQRAPEELAALGGVSWVVGNAHKSEIPERLGFAATASEASFVPLSALGAGESRPPISHSNIFTATPLSAPPFPAADRTRPTLKIQDGCNHRCAYCVIPFVRGRSRSLPVEKALETIRAWVAAGIQEIVLSGIDLGSYGHDLNPRATLLVLTQRILEETALPLLRLSSIEPADLTVDFLDLIARSGRIARHLHAPLQAGSNRILRRMARPYRAEDYAARILEAAEKLPNAGLGADVMVGFPGETADDFQQTCRLVERLPFSYVHVFSFSPRPGTRAWGLSDEVPSNAIQERARTLRALAAEKQRRFRTAQVGQTLRVVTLRRPRPDGRREALSENYLKVVVAGGAAPNQLLPVRIEGVEADHLVGVLAA